MVKLPIPDSYWVVPGRLLAGEYAGAAIDADALPRLEAFRAAGITSFVDLTEKREGLTRYEPLLDTGTRFQRQAITDLGCPSVPEMTEILDVIDTELERGETVYVHCWGGHGRTGSVVGCWLVRHGLSGEEALERIAHLRHEVPEADWHASPETEAQREFVLSWAASDGQRS